ncbi:MAG: DUF4430 domain-containing protein [Thermoleophilaceae bacterium]
MTSWPATVCAVLAIAAGTAGCGLGAGDEQGGDGATLRVTRDFGHELLESAEVDALRESDTVMRLLRAQAGDVETAYGGRFVSSIGGLAMEGGGEPRDWFYWVNGVEASIGAGEYELSPGDVVQWDHRRWAAAMRVPAIVGAYPEPLLHGLEGKRLPVRVECADPRGRACATAKERLGEAGVTATGSALGSPASGEVIRVVVAPWQRARELASIQAIEEGPAESGVFARFEDRGRELLLLGADGEPVRPAPAGSGLVAAISFAEAKSVWVVTGVDEAGVLAASAALDEEVLRDAFAVAVLPAGAQKLPLVEGGG